MHQASGRLAVVVCAQGPVDVMPLLRPDRPRTDHQQAASAFSPGPSSYQSKEIHRACAVFDLNRALAVGGIAVDLRQVLTLAGRWPTDDRIHHSAASYRGPAAIVPCTSPTDGVQSSLVRLTTSSGAHRRSTQAPPDTSSRATVSHLLASRLGPKHDTLTARWCVGQLCAAVRRQEQNARLPATSTATGTVLRLMVPGSGHPLQLVCTAAHLLHTGLQPSHDSVLRASCPHRRPVVQLVLPGVSHSRSYCGQHRRRESANPRVAAETLVGGAGGRGDALAWDDVLDLAILSLPCPSTPSGHAAPHGARSPSATDPSPTDPSPTGPSLLQQIQAIFRWQEAVLGDKVYLTGFPALRVPVQPADGAPIPVTTCGVLSGVATASSVGNGAKGVVRDVLSQLHTILDTVMHAGGKSEGLQGLCEIRDVLQAMEENAAQFPLVHHITAHSTAGNSGAPVYDGEGRIISISTQVLCVDTSEKDVMELLVQRDHHPVAYSSALREQSSMSVPLRGVTLAVPAKIVVLMLAGEVLYRVLLGPLLSYSKPIAARQLLKWYGAVFRLRGPVSAALGDIASVTTDPEGVESVESEAVNRSRL